jgi:hypothetical protein
LLQPLDAVRAYELALKFDDFYELRDPPEAEEYLRRWVREARASELEPLATFTETLEAHRPGVIRWHTTHVSHGLLEGPELPDPGGRAQSPRISLSVQLQDGALPRRRQALGRTSGRVTRQHSHRIHTQHREEPK